MLIAAIVALGVGKGSALFRDVRQVERKAGSTR